MNYIELINQFWSTRRRVRLTSTEADLYFCLLQECNLRGWANPFECPNGLICAIISIDEMTLSRARNGLQQKGLIKFEKGQRKAKSPVYSLLYPNFEGISVGISVGITEGKSVNIINKQNQTKEEAPPNPPAGDPELPLGIPPKDLQKEKAEFVHRVRDAYHEYCKGLAPIRTLTPKRQQAIVARRAENNDDAIFEMLKIAGASKFLAGQNKNQWTADFDWLFKPLNFIKILEHKYDDKAKQYDNVRTTAGGDQRNSFTGEYSEAF